MPAIVDADAVVRRAVLILKAGRVLGLPLLVTEQNPRAFGPTVPALRPFLPPGGPIGKMAFSCLGDPAFREAVARSGRTRLLVFGVESHVCVAQTVLGAREEGWTVHVAADAVSARIPLDRQVGLDRMRSAGAVITTAEMAVYELLGAAGTEEFRKLLPAIKASAAEGGGVSGS